MNKLPLTSYPSGLLWDICQRRLLRHGFKPIESLHWPASDYTIVQDPSIALSILQDEFLSTKPISWVDTLQSKRTVS